MIHPAFRFGYFIQVEKPGCTTVAFPVEIVGRVAMAPEFETKVFASWTMGERNMVVSDIVKEMDFVFSQKEAGGN